MLTCPKSGKRGTRGTSRHCEKDHENRSLANGPSKNQGLERERVRNPKQGQEEIDAGTEEGGDTEVPVWEKRLWPCGRRRRETAGVP